MSAVAPLPRAAEPFVQFSSVLRSHGFVVAPQQTQTFIEAVGLLGPRSMRDIYFAALATLAPPHERRDEFDALYRLVFLGHSLPGASGMPEDNEDLRAFDEREGETDPPQAEDTNDSGEQASAAEVLSLRDFSVAGDDAALHQFSRQAQACLPRRKTLRYQSAGSGRLYDFRQGMRDSVKREGELLQLPKRRRKEQQRRIVLLIDISGSMKAQTDSYLRFAHTLSSVSDHLEVFTLGTRLTRVSRAIALKNREQALATAATVVADWDGGTRLGDALQAFLAIPRFAGFVRGAMVLILSDGLERGDHSALHDAMQRMSRLSWRITWLTPLAADAGFEPRTAALLSVMPFIDELGNGLTGADVCAHLLRQSRTTQPGIPG